MTIRTSRKSMTFLTPFHLPEFEEPLPAGTYEVDTDEEVIEGNVHTVFRRVATSLRIRTGGTVEHHPVDPEHLDEALERDQKAARTAVVPPPALGASLAGRWVSLWVRNARADGGR